MSKAATAATAEMVAAARVTLELALAPDGAGAGASFGRSVTAGS